MNGDSMRIVSWNCEMALWKKYEAIQNEFDADIYVIPECANPAKSKSENYKEFAKNYIWIGENKNKGLGIFAKNEDIKLKYIGEVNNKFAEDYLSWGNVNEDHIGKFSEEDRKFDEIKEMGLLMEFRHFLPVRINNIFNLLAVWAMKPYVEVIHDFYNANKGLFNKNLVICGDLNSSIRFDENGEHKGKNFGMLIEKLDNHGLVPVFHHFNEEEILGHESKITYLHQKNSDNGFHLDHVFANPDIVDDLDIIDDVIKWKKLSDHFPVVFDFDENKFNKNLK